MNTTVVLSKNTRSQLEELERLSGSSKSAIIRLAIDELYLKEKKLSNLSG